MLRTSDNPLNLEEKQRLLAESDENDPLYWLKVRCPGSIIRISAMKYIDRMEIEFVTAEKCDDFHYLCEDLFFGPGFMVENVSWTRSEEYLTVIGATFVRFTEVKE